MEAKEKAKELVEIYKIIIADDVVDMKIIYGTLTNKLAKQCALIAVDEILDLNLGLSNCDENNWDIEKFYKEVRNEINKL